MLNAPLCGNARGKGVFDKRHLRDSIGDLDEFRRATSSGDNHVHVCRTRAQRLDHRVEFHPAVDERVSHLIEDDKKMIATCNRRGRPQPTSPCQLRRLSQVLAFPAEPITETFELESQFLECAMLAEARHADLHELEEAYRLATADRAHGKSNRRRRLALAIAGVDDQKSPPRTGRFAIPFFGRWSFSLHGGTPLKARAPIAARPVALARE